jgi:hypothetical protein
LPGTTEILRWVASNAISITALLVGGILLWKVRREHVLRKRLDLANEVADLLAELTRIVKLWAEIDGKEDTFDKLTTRLEEISPKVFAVRWRVSLLMPWRIANALGGVIRAAGMTSTWQTTQMVHTLKAYENSLPTEKIAALFAQAEGARAANLKTKVEAPKLFERRCLALMNDLRVMLHGRVRGHLLNWSYRRLRLIDTSFWDEATAQRKDPAASTNPQASRPE